MFPGGAFGLLRKRTFPTAEFDWDVVVVLFRAMKAKRSPEPTTAATSEAIKTTYRVLRCFADFAMTLAGVFVTGPGNETLPGLPSARVVARVGLSFADVVYSEADELIGDGENWDEVGVKGAGVVPGGREGRSGLYEFTLLVSGVAVGPLSSAGTGTLRDSATAMVRADALG